MLPFQDPYSSFPVNLRHELKCGRHADKKGDHEKCAPAPHDQPCTPRHYRILPDLYGARTTHQPTHNHRPRLGGCYAMFMAALLHIPTTLCLWTLWRALLSSPCARLSLRAQSCEGTISAGTLGDAGRAVSTIVLDQVRLSGPAMCVPCVCLFPSPASAAYPSPGLSATSVPFCSR